MNKKAVALLSGGLDSTLAVKVLLDQGIEVTALNFLSPFCRCNSKTGCRLESRKVAEKLGIELKVTGLGKDYLEIVKSPPHGYGKNMNPCIDCRILMLKKAKEYMEESGASFLITGEVLGQRPMSQHKQAMRLIEREAGIEGLILRPLSAKLLEPTTMEKLGLIDRQKLLDISGRSRKPQMQLAIDYGLKDYPCPAGGCLLTDPGFAKRLKDHLKYSDELSFNDVELLKIGRHFRPSNSTKIIVGRNKEENDRLLQLVRGEDVIFKVADYVGPLVISRGRVNGEIIPLAAGITVRYSDAPAEIPITVSYQRGEEKYSIEETAIEDSQLEVLRI
ncbi:MAG: hypothetical protein AB1797_01170 [bacterium]